MMGPIKMIQNFFNICSAITRILRGKLYWSICFYSDVISSIVHNNGNCMDAGSEFHQSSFSMIVDERKHSLVAMIGMLPF